MHGSSTGLDGFCKSQSTTWGHGGISVVQKCGDRARQQLRAGCSSDSSPCSHHDDEPGDQQGPDLSGEAGEGVLDLLLKVLDLLWKGMRGEGGYDVPCSSAP